MAHTDWNPGWSDNTAFIYAFTYIASGIATILHFTYPVYVAIGSVWLLNKKDKRKNNSPCVECFRCCFYFRPFRG